MQTLTALLLIATVTGVLYVMWSLLDFTFNLIDQWHAHAHESVKAESAIKEKDGSKFS